MHLPRQHVSSIFRMAPRRGGKSPITGRPWTQSTVLLVKTPMGRFTNWPSCAVQSPPKPTGSRVKVLVTQSCLALCNPTDCSPSGASVHGILQARILKWVAISYSREASQVALVVKNPLPMQEMQETTPGFTPWIRKILWRRALQSIPVFLPGEFHGQRSLVRYSPWGHKVRHD